MKIIYSTVVEDGLKKRKCIILGVRKCKICGSQYQPSRQDSIVCSDCSGSRGVGSYVKIGNNRRWVELKQRKCLECGNDFKPKRTASLYCSRKCSKKSCNNGPGKEKARLRARKWYQNNLDKARETRKEAYWKNPELGRKKAKEWREKNLDRARNNSEKFKDNIRHGGIRGDIIKESEGICSMCGKDTRIGWRDSCVHHETFDSEDHSEQVLLCRSCHIKVHKLNQ